MIMLMLIIGIVLIVMSALLLLAVPVAGILGIAFGVILILYSRSLKKKKAAEEAERQAAAAARAEESKRLAAEKEIGNCFIAGLYHHKAAVKDLLGDEDYFYGDCDLVPEPDNPVDPNAIRIEVDGELIGYVPAKMCEKIHKLLPRAASCYAEIDKSEDGDLTGKVTIYEAGR